MTIQGERAGRRHIQADAALAEIIVADKAFRDADAAPYLNAEPEQAVVDAHASARTASEQLILAEHLEAVHNNSPEHKWSLSRAAASKELAGTALGAFSQYFSEMHGEHEPQSLDAIAPEAGPSIIRTNSNILALNRSSAEPVDFLDAALGVIERQRGKSRANVGPGNYATALKFFRDRYLPTVDNPEIKVDLDEARPLVSESLKGFFDSVDQIPPNFLEMNNIYSAIRTLPAGMIESEFTKQSLELVLIRWISTTRKHLVSC